MSSLLKIGLRLVRSVPRNEMCRKTFNNICKRNIASNTTLVLLQPKSTTYCSYRNKSKRKLDSDEEGDNFDDDLSLSKDSKVVKFNSTSLRTDMVLKSALNISRNKIEQKFYESKIRVNGNKIMKKSISIKEGDEIDIIKSVSPKNPNHLYVTRVEIVSLAANEDSISITARRFKTLLVDNYESDPYKGSSSDS